MCKKYIIIITLLVAIFSSYLLYTAIFGKNINVSEQAQLIKLSNKTNISELLMDSSIHLPIKSKLSLNLVLKLKKYDGSIDPGNYLIEPNLNNNTFVNILRGGLQAPVMVTFNNIRTKEELAGKLGSQILIDSAEILSLLKSPEFLQQFHLDTNTSVCPFLPDSYEMYWTISAEGLFKRMIKEKEKFWTTERAQKAIDLNLNYTELITLASIVNEESNLAKEQPVIAGLYINRLKRGYLLQADPTLRFALKDFDKKRILNADKKIDSPFNTYKFKGLPPGPIRIPTKSAIDAVLNYKKHNYLYMCAKADFSGEHHFSETLTEHLRYARAYHRKLNQLRIYK